MHFTNTIFSSNSNKNQEIKNSIVFGNMILESTRKAELSEGAKLLLTQAQEALKSDPKKLLGILQQLKEKHPADIDEFSTKLFENSAQSVSSLEDKKKSGADKIIDVALESSKDVGKPARAGFELQKERVKQIALSRGWLPSSELAEWFRVFFDVHNLKEDIVLKILNIAHNASVKSGASTSTVLSLFNNMYSVFPDTDKIVTVINATADLQAKYRSYGLFDVLRSMAKSPQNNTRYDFDFDNEADNIVWQELKSLVLKAPLEDQSYLAVEWSKSEAIISRALEKAAKLRQVSDQIDQIGNNLAASRVINSLVTLQKGLESQAWFKGFQGVIYSIYAGYKAWQVFSAPITNTPPVIDLETNQTQYKLEGTPSSLDSARSVGSSTHFKIVTAQTESVSQEDQFIKIKTEIIEGLKLVKKSLGSNLKNIGFLQNIIDKIIAVMSEATFDSYISGGLLNNLKNSVLGSNSGQVKPAKKEATFVKTSQLDVASGAAGVTSVVGTGAAVFLIFKFFQQNMKNLKDKPEDMIKLALLAVDFIIEAISTLFSFFGQPLTRDSYFYNTDGSIKKEAFTQFNDAVQKLGGTINDSQVIATLDNTITRKLKAIEELENAVNAQIERDVQAGSESKILRAPADPSAKFAQNIDTLSKLIGDAMTDSQNLISLYDKILKNKDKIAIDPLNASLIGTGRRRALVTYEKLKSKRQRYISVSVVKDQIARFIRLNALLGPIMARVRKFNNLGMSLAPLISDSKSNPTSLLKTMYEIRKNEQKKLDIVDAKIKEIKARVPNAESYTDSKYIGI